MKTYRHFIGIDIGKYTFFAAVHGRKDTQKYDNTENGIVQFLKDYKSIFTGSLCVLETTGGHESKLLYTLCDRKIDVHRADSRKVKNFIRSYGTAVKTDKLDAKALAKYAMERKENLELFMPQSDLNLELYSLVQRRADLKKISVAEKNRLQSPSLSISCIASSCEFMIENIEKEINIINQAIKELIDSDPILKQKKKILKTIPGIGDITAFTLLTLLPELGTLNRKKIASLAGLAPIANESGTYQGYRRTGHGRGGIKPILFTAAMSASRSNSDLKDFYQKLIGKGKKKMVALTAVMRKMLVIANAKLKEAYPPVVVDKER